MPYMKNPAPAAAGGGGESYVFRAGSPDSESAADRQAGYVAVFANRLEPGDIFADGTRVLHLRHDRIGRRVVVTVRRLDGSTGERHCQSGTEYFVRSTS